jgi:hypothetical protein
MGLILDSSIVIAAERRGDTVAQLIQNIVKAAGDQEAALSAIGLTELIHGIYRVQTEKKRPAPRIIHQRTASRSEGLSVHQGKRRCWPARSMESNHGDQAGRSCRQDRFVRQGAIAAAGSLERDQSRILHGGQTKGGRGEGRESNYGSSGTTDNGGRSLLCSICN